MILLKHVTAVSLLWLRGLSGEQQAHFSAIEKSFNYINGGGLSSVYQNKLTYIAV